MDVDQSCAGCVKPTAAGLSRFAGRRTILHADAKRSYLCVHCEVRLSSGGRSEPLSDDELRREVESGAMTGMLWSGGGQGIGGG